MDKQEYNKIGREVVKKYKEEILPKCVTFEEERIKIKNCSKWIILAAVIVSIVICAIEKGLVLNIIIPIIAIAVLINIFFAKNFENKVKEAVMQYFCDCFGDLRWVNKTEIFNYIDEGIFKASNLFKVNDYTVNHYDDVFSGEFHDVPFQVIEMQSFIPRRETSTSRRNALYSNEGVNVNGLFNLAANLASSGSLSSVLYDNSASRSSRSRRNSTDREICFKGVIIKIKLDKSFNGNTVIRPDNFMHFSPDSKLKHTTLEDVQFEKKFDVFTTDEVEARYLITTAFMDRLNNLKMAFNIDKISCAFYNQNLLIGLHTNKDLFKFASIGKSLYDYSEFSKLFKEIMSIYEMIDYFKFGEKTKI